MSHLWNAQKLDDWLSSKSSKLSASVKRNDASDNVNESATVKKNNKRERKHVKFANLTVEETLAIDDCNLSMLTDKVPKGKFVFDTGADVHVCTDVSMFKPNDPPEYT